LLHPANQRAVDRAAVMLDRLEQLPMGAGLYAGLRELESVALGSAAAVRASALWAGSVSMRNSTKGCSNQPNDSLRASQTWAADSSHRHRPDFPAVSRTPSEEVELIALAPLVA